MTNPKKYWLVDESNTWALVEGTEQRDRWKPLGWTESDEPSGVGQVWLRHEEHGGRARFPASIIDVWAAKGWHPSDPPEPESLLNAPPAPVPAGSPVPAVEAPAATTTAASAATTKER